MNVNSSYGIMTSLADIARVISCPKKLTTLTNKDCCCLQKRHSLLILNES